MLEEEKGKQLELERVIAEQQNQHTILRDQIATQAAAVESAKRSEAVAVEAAKRAEAAAVEVEKRAEAPIVEAVNQNQDLWIQKIEEHVAHYKGKYKALN